MLPSTTIPPTPTIQDGIDAFGLDILRGGGHLTTDGRGGFAITDDGDIKLGDDTFNAMARLLKRWRYHAPALSILFDLVHHLRDERDAAEVEMRAFMAVLPTQRLTPSDAAEAMHRYQAINDTLGSGDHGPGAYAGTIMVVSGAMLRRYWRDLRAPKAAWRAAAPHYASHSFGAVVEAAGNNFRHHDEWAASRDSPTPQQMASISILRDVLPSGGGLPIDMGRNLCAEVLAALDDGKGFMEFGRRLFAFAKALA